MMPIGPLLQWTDENEGITHLVEEDQGWAAVYCTWLTVEQHTPLKRDAAPTCVQCIGYAVITGRRWFG